MWQALIADGFAAMFESNIGTSTTTSSIKSEAGAAAQAAESRLESS
jgi:xanthine/uracil/vitamin C permease (AzgA family)